MPAAPQPAEDKKNKSETLCDLEKAEETLSGLYGTVNPDLAQKVVHEYRENQANGAGEDYDEKLEKLKRRIKKGSRLRFKRKKN